MAFTPKAACPAELDVGLSEPWFLQYSSIEQMRITVVYNGYDLFMLCYENEFVSSYNL